MMREYQVRICERLGVKFPGPTRPTRPRRSADFKALVEGFNALGYVDQQNVRLEHRFPNETPDLFKRMAAELVAAKVDVLVGVGVTAAPHLKNATTTIPVVLTVAPDPVAARLIDSLARPGGNITGLTFFAGELAAKRVQ